MKRTTMTVELECGHPYVVPLVLLDGETLLGSAAAGDQMLGMIDSTHDVHHPECAEGVTGRGQR